LGHGTSVCVCVRVCVSYLTLYVLPSAWNLSPGVAGALKSIADLDFEGEGLLCPIICATGEKSWLWLAAGDCLPLFLLGPLFLRASLFPPSRGVPSFPKSSSRVAPKPLQNRRGSSRGRQIRRGLTCLHRVHPFEVSSVDELTASEPSRQQEASESKPPKLSQPDHLILLTSALKSPPSIHSSPSPPRSQAAQS
jgi:hypothetical protein